MLCSLAQVATCTLLAALSGRAAAASAASELARPGLRMELLPLQLAFMQLPALLLLMQGCLQHRASIAAPRLLLLLLDESRAVSILLVCRLLHGSSCRARCLLAGATGWTSSTAGTMCRVPFSGTTSSRLNSMCCLALQSSCSDAMNTTDRSEPATASYQGLLPAAGAVLWLQQLEQLWQTVHL